MYYIILSYISQLIFVGLAITYSLNLSSYLSNFLHDFIETEKSFISLERCQDIDKSLPIEFSCVETKYFTPYSPDLIRKMGEGRKKDWIINKDNVSLQHLNTQVFEVHGTMTLNAVNLKLANNSKKRAQSAVHILKNVNASIKTGNKVAVIGRTGSGKSSFLKTLMRVYDMLPGPMCTFEMAERLNFFGLSGQILINNVDIRSIPLEQLRDMILMITQESFLISSSIRRNLDPDNYFSDDQIKEVMSRCNLEGELLERNIGEDGCCLSQGEKQKMSISRAILTMRRRNRVPDFILLDEPTAYVDSNNETIIYDALLQEFPDATYIFITHNLSFLRTFGEELKLMVFDSGTVAECDLIKNLLSNKDSIFYEMWTASNLVE